LATCRIFQARATWIAGSRRLVLQIHFRPAGRLGGSSLFVRLVNRTKEGQGQGWLLVTGRTGPG
jgi:predicted neutral ceramidase superfamily lipid hydrolase